MLNTILFTYVVSIRGCLTITMLTEMRGQLCTLNGFATFGFFGLVKTIFNVWKRLRRKWPWPTLILCPYTVAGGGRRDIYMLHYDTYNPILNVLTSVFRRHSLRSLISATLTEVFRAFPQL
jgi:hypothetical protein